MKRIDHVARAFGLIATLFAGLAAAADARPPLDLSSPADLKDGDLAALIGGMGSVYFLVEPGELSRGRARSTSSSFRDTTSPAAHRRSSASREPAGEPGSNPQPLVVPPFSDYSVFYHRLTIDREGRLWLSYDYWSTYWFHRNDHVGSRRALLTSSDAGKTWNLASDEHAPGNR